jgi:hypothetical protein
LEIVEIASLATITTSWSPMSIRISELITPTSTMTVSFRISDYSPNVNITEAGVDYFFVTNSSVLNVNELSQAVYIYPNPARDHIIIESNQDETFKLIDLNGNVLIHGATLDKKAYVDISKLAVGTYLLHLGSTSKLVIKE